MPPPQPWGLPLEENVKVSSSNTVRVVLDPPPFVPVTYVANAPITNSFGLKNEAGGGGGGAITCFEDTTGSPAKVATACPAIATMVKTIIFFIKVVSLTEIQLLLIGLFFFGFWLVGFTWEAESSPASSQVSPSARAAAPRSWRLE
jgi:hypothetical protein